MSRYIVGIDPGKSGGVALLDVDNPYIKSIAWSRTGMTEKDICDELRNYSSVIFKAYLEKVHSMPKQGVASSFTFGADYGMYKGLLMGLHIPFEEVSPAVWQRSLKCLTKGDKNVTKRKAQQLFPNLKITHATADALLIAEYGRLDYLDI